MRWKITWVQSNEGKPESFRFYLNLWIKVKKFAHLFKKFKSNLKLNLFEFEMRFNLIQGFKTHTLNYM